MRKNKEKSAEVSAPPGAEPAAVKEIQLGTLPYAVGQGRQGPACLAREEGIRAARRGDERMPRQEKGIKRRGEVGDSSVGALTPRPRRVEEVRVL
jgi:hypothetical protein